MEMQFKRYESHSVVSDSLQPHRLYSPWNSPGQDSGVGSLSLLQGIFPTQGSNPGLLHCRRILYHLSHRGSPQVCLHTSVVSDSMWHCGLQSARLLCPWDSPGKNTGVGWLCPPTEDLPNPGTEPASLMSPASGGGFLPRVPPARPNSGGICHETRWCLLQGPHREQEQWAQKLKDRYSWLHERGKTEKGDTEGQVGPRSGRAYRARETNSDVTWGRMGIYLEYSLSSGLTIRLAFSTVTLVDSLNGLEGAWAEAERPVWGLWSSWEITACIGRVGKKQVN